MGNLNTRQRLILLKTESSYGVDSTPTGADNAMLVSGLDISPFEGSTVERDVIRSYLGRAEMAMAEKYSKISFDVEVGGHAALVVGAVPMLDAALKACALTGTQNNRSITGITRSSSTATATTSGSHLLAVGSKAAISGAVETEYNGTVTVLTVPTATTFTYAVTGTPVSPATGAIVMKKSYSYAPISDSIGSCVIYGYVDGVLHKITGARGNVSIDFSVKNYPKFRFNMIGIFNDPTDTANATPVFTNYTKPVIVNTANTTGISLLGYSPVLEQLSVDLANQVQYETLAGLEAAEIRDRKPSGSISIRATTVAEKNFWSSVSTQEEGALALQHGQTPGNILEIACSKVQLDSPKYKDLNGSQMLTANLAIMPTSGNDEITITFR